MRTHIGYRFVLVAFLQSLLLADSTLAMQPSEEAKRDPVFLAEHNCVREYFVAEENIEKGNWLEVIRVVDGLEARGYTDRFLTLAKAKAIARRGNYEEALRGFQKALQETYKCRLTIPRLTFAPVPALADQAILWYNIYETYEGMGNPSGAEEAYEKAKELMWEALKIPSKEEFESVAGRVFYAKSIFRGPLD